MKKINPLFNSYMKLACWLIAISTLMPFLSSCTDDGEQLSAGGTFVKFGIVDSNNQDSLIGNDFVLELPKAGGSQYYFMYSDIGRWKLVPDEDSKDAVITWPSEGVGDGRFGIRVVENAIAYERDIRVNVVNPQGAIMGTLYIKQEPGDPYFSINYSETPKFVPSVGETFDVRVNANMNWEAEVEQGSDWILLGEDNDSIQSITIVPNSGGIREGRVKFYSPDLLDVIPSYLNIRQLNSENDFDKAQRVSIGDLLARISGGVGTINENLYIEGTVISDRSKRALAPTQMIIQDESNKGLWIEFSDAADNIFDLNDKVKLHVYGASFELDSYSKGSKIVSFSPSFVHDQTPSSGVIPIEISNVADLAQYENVLVTLKSVEFALPFGTSVNIAESYYNTRPSTWTATAEPYADDTNEYGHLLRDNSGNIVKLYTAVTFMDRFKASMPWGSGDITGIVMKRVKNNEENYILRLRSHEDNRIAPDRSSALSTTLMQIGPWRTNAALPGITASIGIGTLTYTGRANQNVSSSSTPTAFYYAYSQARMDPPYELNEDGSPVIAYSNSISFAGMNTQYWWGNPSSSISQGSSGEAWVITTSTANATGSGSLFLQFNSSSSTSGPAEFIVEWAESEDTPMANWNYVTEYTVCDINNSQHLMQYAFKLPNEAKGKSTLVIRLRVKSNQRATLNGNSIATGGTNRLGMVTLTQLKN